MLDAWQVFNIQYSSWKLDVKKYENSDDEVGLHEARRDVCGHSTPPQKIPKFTFQASDGHLPGARIILNEGADRHQLCQEKCCISFSNSLWAILVGRNCDRVGLLCHVQVSTAWYICKQERRELTVIGLWGRRDLPIPVPRIVDGE